MIKNNEVAEGSTSKNIDKARQKLATMNMTDEEKKRYEKYLINLIRDKDVVNTAKEEGRDQGRIEGLLESEIKGKLEGKLEGKIEVAKALKQNGIAVEIIINATGLTKEQISEL
jgi:predicted transposase/invertase (TIGR01784 family)